MPVLIAPGKLPDLYSITTERFAAVLHYTLQHFKVGRRCGSRSDHHHFGMDALHDARSDRFVKPTGRLRSTGTIRVAAKLMGTATPPIARIPRISSIAAARMMQR